MFKAQTVGMEYERGSYQLVQGVKQWDERSWIPDEDDSGDFTRFIPRRNGWGEMIRPSKLILNVRLEGKAHDVWVDRFFKNRIGRLTQKRQRIIMQTMPNEVNLIERQSKRGTRYYQVTDEDMEEWLKRVEVILAE